MSLNARIKIERNIFFVYLVKIFIMNPKPYVKKSYNCPSMDQNCTHESYDKVGSYSDEKVSYPNDPTPFNSKGTLWSTVGDNYIISASNTFPTLEAGYYNISANPQIGLYLQKYDIELNKIYRLPNSATDLLLNDINKFWTLEDTYKKYNRVFRRNYLIYSAPGTGKTSLINLMCQDLIEKYNGIVLTITKNSDYELYIEAIRKIREIEPNRKIITIIEDIDNFIGNGEGPSVIESFILSILDGNFKVGGVVTIATTNYIERIAERYKNRPSRFDRVVEFPLPNEESRKVFIEKSVLPEDLAKIDIEKWVDKTEGFTIDHINELILLYFVYGHSEEESFETIRNMVENNNNLKNDTSCRRTSMGFGGK
mgnify:CR=1 FL=1